MGCSWTHWAMLSLLQPPQDWTGLSLGWGLPLPGLQTAGSSRKLDPRPQSAPLRTKKSHARRGKHVAKLLFHPHLLQALQLTNEYDFPPLTGHHIPSSSLASDGPLSSPPLSTAVSKQSVSPINHRSQRYAPFSRPGCIQFTPRPITNSPVQASESERATTSRLFTIRL